MCKRTKDNNDEVVVTYSMLHGAQKPSLFVRSKSAMVMHTHHKNKD